MATSGTQFSINLEQLITEAAELAGANLLSGEDLKRARTSLGLLLIDMQNRGHPLAELEQKTLTVASASTTYTLSAGIIDVVDAVVVRSSVATPLERISLFEYHKIPQKTTKGPITQFATNPGRDQTTLYLYLAPENSTDVIDYWCLTRMEAPGSNYQNTLDVADRYLPALTFGLAYYLLLKKPNITKEELVKRTELRELYIDCLTNAQVDDRERSSLIVTPFPYNGR